MHSRNITMETNTHIWYKEYTLFNENSLIICTMGTQFSFPVLLLCSYSNLYQKSLKKLFPLVTYELTSKLLTITNGNEQIWVRLNMKYKMLIIYSHLLCTYWRENTDGEIFLSGS